MKKKAKSSKRESDFLKIVYFDEEAATDLIYMCNKGEVVESLTRNYDEKVRSELAGSATIAAKSNIFSLFKLGIGIDSSASLSAGSEKLVNQAITNTVLTDYLEIANNEKFVNIAKFDAVQIYAYENSMTYLKLMTPYFTMTEGKFPSGNGIDIDISLIDDALKQGRGYFELVFDKENVKRILRFNLKSFKSSYSLSDLVKMNLTYHAVKVGKMKLDDLDFSREFITKKDRKSVV